MFTSSTCQSLSSVQHRTPPCSKTIMHTCTPGNYNNFHLEEKSSSQHVQGVDIFHILNSLTWRGYHIYIYTLPGTNSSPLKRWLPKRKGSSSNHPFSGAFAVTFREGIHPRKLTLQKVTPFNYGHLWSLCKISGGGYYIPSMYGIFTYHLPWKSTRCRYLNIPVPWMVWVLYTSSWNRGLLVVVDYHRPKCFPAPGASWRHRFECYYGGCLARDQPA